MLSLLREHPLEAHITGVCVEDEWQLRIGKNQHGNLHKLSSDQVECSSAVFSPDSRSKVLNETLVVSPRNLQSSAVTGELASLWAAFPCWVV